MLTKILSENVRNDKYVFGQEAIIEILERRLRKCLRAWPLELGRPGLEFQLSSPVYLLYVFRQII